MTTTTTTTTAARFLHMKGDDAIVGRALHSARNLLNLIEGNTPAGYAIRALLDGQGLDLAVVRAEVEAALNLPLPEAAPEAAPAAPAAPLPDVETAVRDAVTKALAALDIERMARDFITQTVEDNMPDVDEAARELIDERVDNDMPDVDDLAREIVQEKVDSDLDLDSAVSDALSGMSVTVTLK